MEEIKTQSGEKLSIPMAIVLAAVIIGGAFLLSNGGSTQQENKLSIRPLSEEDHVLGNIDADVTIVEYSDFECPFCGRHHPTLKQIVADFDGQVNWVYRHLPITTIHSEALGAAVASECVAKLAGNDAFWSFSDTVFESQQGLSIDLYNSTAAGLGIESSAFSACMSDKTIVQEIQDDLDEAQSIGGTGTPFNVVITKSGDFIPFSGAIPYKNVRAIVEQALES